MKSSDTASRSGFLPSTQKWAPPQLRSQHPLQHAPTPMGSLLAYQIWHSALGLIALLRYLKYPSLHALAVERRETRKYTRLENPWGWEAGRWRDGTRRQGRQLQAGLGPQLAKGVCSTLHSQVIPWAEKGNQKQQKVITIHPALYAYVPEYLASVCMHACVSEFERKRKTFSQRGKVMRKCLTSYCYFYFCVRLHLFLERNSIKKEKCFLALWKSNPTFISFL